MAASAVSSLPLVSAGTAFLASLLIAVVLITSVLASSSSSSRDGKRETDDADPGDNTTTSRQYGRDAAAAKAKARATGAVPFFYTPPLSVASAHDDDPLLSVDSPFALELLRSLDRYRSDAGATLSQLGRMEEVARRSEWILGRGDGADPPPPTDARERGGIMYAARLRERIARTAEALERDGDVLEELLRPFEVTLALPAPSEHTSSPSAVGKGLCKQKRDYLKGEREEHRFSRSSMPYYESSAATTTKKSKSSSYDSAAQVIAHVVRDWTSCGKGIRSSLYDWCVAKVRQYSDSADDSSSRSSAASSLPLPPVLVPGAGLGRLAYDIARAGFTVEANELSLTMAAAAFGVLNRSESGVLHPFVTDNFLNEVDSSRRYDAVTFPDASAAKRAGGGGDGGSLSYTIGDFTQIYSSPSHEGAYSSVVTSFFLDTAHNVYAYLLTIRTLLAPRGVWINVGPLQWHSNALLTPSADELRDMMEGMGFHIAEWGVDEAMVDYRCDGDGAGGGQGGSGARFTKVEGYRPLRFVAIKVATDDGSSEAAVGASVMIAEMAAAVEGTQRVFTDTGRKNGAGTTVSGTDEERSGEGERIHIVTDAAEGRSEEPFVEILD